MVFLMNIDLGNLVLVYMQYTYECKIQIPWKKVVE